VASGRVGVPPAGPGVSPGPSDEAGKMPASGRVSHPTRSHGRRVRDNAPHPGGRDAHPTRNHSEPEQDREATPKLGCAQGER